MDRYFILLGGGDLRSKETLPLDTAIANLVKSRVGERRACALFIGTASHDFMPYNNTFHKTYTGELGLKTDVALTVYTRMDDEKLDGKFEKADLIYVGGGDTVFLLNHWKETGLDQKILKAYRAGKVVAGLSAGAICWFEKMYTDSETVTGASVPYAVYPAMGLLRGGACPHYNERRADFAEAIPEGEDWLCVENNAAVVFKNEQLLGALKNGGSAFWVRKEGGKIIEKEINDGKTLF